MHVYHRPTLRAEQDLIRFMFRYTEDEENINVKAREGESLLHVAQQNGVELEGLCQSAQNCGTCHCILENQIYDRLESPLEEEEDLLEYTYGLTTTSRLGCQVMVTRDMENMVVQLPSPTSNFYVHDEVLECEQDQKSTTIL